MHKEETQIVKLSLSLSLPLTHFLTPADVQVAQAGDGVALLEALAGELSAMGDVEASEARTRAEYERDQRVVEQVALGEEELDEARTALDGPGEALDGHLRLAEVQVNEIRAVAGRQRLQLYARLKARQVLGQVEALQRVAHHLAVQQVVDKAPFVQSCSQTRNDTRMQFNSI